MGIGEWDTVTRHRFHCSVHFRDSRETHHALAETAKSGQNSSRICKYATKYGLMYPIGSHPVYDFSSFATVPSSGVELVDIGLAQTAYRLIRFLPAKFALARRGWKFRQSLGRYQILAHADLAK